MTQTNESPENPGRFIWRKRNMRVASSRYNWILTSPAPSRNFGLPRRIAVSNPGSYVDARLLPEMEAIIAGDFAPLVLFVRSAGDGYRPNPALTADRVLLAAAQGDWAGAVAASNAVGPEAQPDPAGVFRAWTLLSAGRTEEARLALEGSRSFHQGRLRADRDPYIEAQLRASLAWVLAHLGDAAGAHENIARADALWGYHREPADGGRVALTIAYAFVALGDHDAAVAQIRPLVTRPSYFPAQRIWLIAQLAKLHRHEPFLA